MLPLAFRQENPSACFGQAIVGHTRNSDRFSVFHAFCDTRNLHAHNSYKVPMFDDLVTFRKVNKQHVHESQRYYILSGFAPIHVKFWVSRDAVADSDHFPVFADIAAL
eukprot:2939633-Heterocapsa_arctica.AAC.1